MSNLKNSSPPSIDFNNLPDDVGVMICGHGSRAKIAEEEFSLLAAGLKARFPQLKIAHGFLEYSAPNIHMGLDSLLAQGVKKIYAVPGMLFSATHAQNDIPSVLTTYQEKHPGLEIEYGKELGLDELMIKAFQQRILEAIDQTEIPKAGDLYDTMLVVVGRGTSVVNANADAAKLTRIVAENLGFGWSQTVYSGVTFPSVGRGLEMALKLGYKKIIVAPYFLFGGKLIDRIYAYIDKVAAKNPEVTFSKAGYLRDQDYVINTFIKRISETMTGPEEVVGLMQDFKNRLARGEVDVHHHHAEFQPDEKDGHSHSSSHIHEHSHGHSNEDKHDDKHDHSHDNSHDTHEYSHDHSHSHDKKKKRTRRHGHQHAPYKHIGHPHGPRTMIRENVCCCFMGQFPQEILDQEIHKIELEGEPSCKKN